jgi:hypothetical protein
MKTALKSFVRPFVSLCPTFQVRADFSSMNADEDSLVPCLATMDCRASTDKL